MPSLALVAPLPFNIFSNQLAPNVPISIPRNAPFCSSALFSIVLLTLFINKPASPRDLMIFYISLIFSFEIINVVMPDQKGFFLKATSLANAAAVKHNGIKTLLSNGLSIFFIKDKPVF